ncbi:hypothetical protein [Clostridium sardiniense]|uniref:hypothetical protein n=1 Tax=Clostridium sardiniense TaxID=29369 RepID=UPI003D32E95A
MGKYTKLLIIFFSCILFIICIVFGFNIVIKETKKNKISQISEFINISDENKKSELQEVAEFTYEEVGELDNIQFLESNVDNQSNLKISVTFKDKALKFDRVFSFKQVINEILKNDYSDIVIVMSQELPSKSEMRFVYNHGKWQ